MAVALLLTPASMTAEQYERVIKQLEASGAGAPLGRRFHACFGPDGHLAMFEVWDSVEEFQDFVRTLMPIVANEQIEMAAAEPVEIHRLIEGSEASSLRKTIDGLRDQAFFRRPVEKLKEKIRKAPEERSADDTRGGTTADER
jgi:hypothetical protein